MIRVDAGSLRTTILAMERLDLSEREAARQSLEAAGNVLHREIRRNVSYSDHSLAALRALDHPYARRHGSIQIHGDRPHVVHRQSGTLVRGLHRALVDDPSGGPRYQVWIDPGAVPHARYVVEGTRVMLPRDVLWETATQDDVRRDMMRAVVRVLGPRLRARAAVRFGVAVRAGGTATGLF